eukprot:CAMPEP_0183360078 /NCGR_PEP_ID=MMETSP0164_2-20130417/54211_1 /TAXON_ID=221442 /ORGANISM="Coccolithus pelagicus ssp braarudi, Strain PLY182g" /LENGTH=195 /DNA_ID=CAMNT_0025534345 /DNA_START=252 /DNA_END=840 /DNA_ORIENTATION=+
MLTARPGGCKRRTGHKDEPQDEQVLPPQALAPKKRGAASKPTSARSPKKQRRSPSKRSGDGEPHSVQKRKVTWRSLSLDTQEPSTLEISLDGAEEPVDVHEDNSFTAHCDATVRTAAMADWVQQGASAEGHIDDVVAVNDVLRSKVDEDVETADLAVVQELEAGSVPNDVLPAPVSSLFRQRDGLADERDVAAKL